MKKIFTPSHVIRTILIFCMIPFTACTQAEEPFDELIPLEDYSIFIQDSEQEAIFMQAIQACQTSIHQGKSIGVFGGSLSSLPESDIAKGLWMKYLKTTIKTYGSPGSGFCTKEHNIQQQVDNAGIHDIYILWASTNDYTSLLPVGLPTDYTEYDRFNTSRQYTQCGGINYCIKQLREKNPECTIYLFTSLKFFGPDGEQVYGYNQETDKDNGAGLSFYAYTQRQKECARLQGISYFDQWKAQEGRIRKDNFNIYYKEDGCHMTEYGYFDIGIRQLLFLAQQGKQ